MTFNAAWKYLHLLTCLYPVCNRTHYVSRLMNAPDVYSVLYNVSSNGVREKLFEWEFYSYFQCGMKWCCWTAKPFRLKVIISAARVPDIRRPLISEFWVRLQGSPWKFYGAGSNSWTGFSTSRLILLSQYNSISSSHTFTRSPTLYNLRNGEGL
jgi:hypothetical protein